ncbi:hypothetical protein GGI04_001309 [Coemansia thaxteri]|uniref:NAD-dependent epimerase/dehydratase domain-containing protein n=1 Tax=Coemansia thaxteri TaxID=2663907 RepID=A0A9W8B932_9FUNG|nr:hypothetical protein H4R26_004642 [Coemansia thaxteri]KAJ2007985.1 hypothetical protein GGI04_001309 [Coemansia thaxteri]KAJ2470237.1 hypothetical protein GGI02_003064 [Coemansia sp. RSA 2322]KAJ2477531.1 hypothetical protein EV174_004592 [Coemansia sp. RSA 2320]
MPSCLVLGCANFYGRALIELLCAQRDAAKDSWHIRGVDKVLPQLASFPRDVEALYATIDFRMGNLRNPTFLEQAFAEPPGATTWDYVFNFAPEHKFGLAAQAYDQDVRQMSGLVAQLARARGAGVLVHLSSALVYGAHGNARAAEDAALVDKSCELPLARSHAAAEALVAQAAGDGLAAVVLRPALCYGPGDRQNAVPMLIMAQLSRISGSPLPVLWGGDRRISTVHVSDVARAALAAAQWRRTKGLVVFNVADEGDTTNAALARAVGALFGVEPAFHGAAASFLARRLRSAAELAELASESLLGPWLELLAEHGVANSPLTPYIDPEHPYCRLDAHPRGVDGARIAATPGLEFEYRRPRLAPAALRDMVAEFQAVGLWPAVPIPQ